VNTIPLKVYHLCGANPAVVCIKFHLVIAEQSIALVWMQASG
jgi:hypothetical protein